MHMEKRFGFIGIIIENRNISAEKVNKILSEYGSMIIGRMGLPDINDKCSVMSLIVKGDTDEMGALTGKLGAIEGVFVRSALSK